MRVQNVSSNTQTISNKQKSIKNAEQETSEKNTTNAANAAINNENIRAVADATLEGVSVIDSIDLSEESAKENGDVVDFAELKEELKNMENDLKRFQEQLEIARLQSEGAAEQWRILIKCLKIAMRIMSGDIVPKADHRYLAKHEPELYSKAITLRMEKENPKKHKRLTKDEKTDKADKTANTDKAAKGDNTENSKGKSVENVEENAESANAVLPSIPPEI